MTGMRVLESADATHWLHRGTEQEELANVTTVTAQGTVACVECAASLRRPESEARPLHLEWEGA